MLLGSTPVWLAGMAFPLGWPLATTRATGEPPPLPVTTPFTTPTTGLDGGGAIASASLPDASSTPPRLCDVPATFCRLNGRGRGAEETGDAFGVPTLLPLCSVLRGSRSANSSTRISLRHCFKRLCAQMRGYGCGSS